MAIGLPFPRDLTPLIQAYCDRLSNEISNFDGDTNPGNGDAASGALLDADSTPDSIRANDNQPLAPGAPTQADSPSYASEVPNRFCREPSKGTSCRTSFHSPASASNW